MSSVQISATSRNARMGFQSLDAIRKRVSLYTRSQSWYTASQGVTNEVTCGLQLAITSVPCALATFVSNFERNIESYLSPNYIEEQACREFIDRFPPTMRC
jgi:hypothetical protein